VTEDPITTGTSFYFALVAAVAAERMLELYLSARNGRRVLARGAIAGESRAFYAAIVLFHVLFLAACPVEVLLFERPFLPALALPATAIVLAAMALRYWAIATLGERWNSRVLVVPGEPAVTGGPYRFVRHPNYVAVYAEVLALPLVHTAWATALAATAVNFVLLRARIRHEESALERASDYAARLGGRPRFLPGASS
jgi:methyltransferase